MNEKCEWVRKDMEKSSCGPCLQTVLLYGETQLNQENISKCLLRNKAMTSVWFHTSATVLMRPSLFWNVNVTMIGSYWCFGTNYQTNLQGSSSPSAVLIDPWKRDWQVVLKCQQRSSVNIIEEEISQTYDLSNTMQGYKKLIYNIPFHKSGKL
jgi:hypothetical protein